MSLQRIQLTLTPERLAALRAATDKRLNVPTASEVARSNGREAALHHLRGKRIMEAKLSNDPRSLAKERLLPTKRKRQSGKSNWPTRK